MRLRNQLEGAMENVKLCGHAVKCWDLHTRPCVREKGHNDGGNVNAHNPFSNTPAQALSVRKPPQPVRNCDLISA